MANINKVFLMGNLTRDPELRYSQSGVAVANFTIAINHIYKTQNGEKKEETDFIRVVVFKNTAENCAKFLNKGKPVFVEGRLRIRQYETPDGQKKYIAEVLANNVQFLGGKPETANTKENNASGAGTEEAEVPSIPPEEDVPF
ncbi:MAG: single-stranded DNA-binding protein [Candidatus Firestonebacteria bacterium]|nr:single-stranded DNA-binding protein [Candidatus Firestonebacteria bacterium]